MLPGTNLCERCGRQLEPECAQFKQTKYCSKCAAEKKKEDSRASAKPRHHDPERQKYMKAYQREYTRRHPGRSTPYVRALRARKRAEREPHIAARWSAA